MDIESPLYFVYVLYFAPPPPMYFAFAGPSAATFGSQEVQPATLIETRSCSAAPQELS